MRKFTYEVSEQREIVQYNKLGTYLKTTETFCNTKRDHGLFVCNLQQFKSVPHVLLSTINETIIAGKCDYRIDNCKFGDIQSPGGFLFIEKLETEPNLAVWYSAGPVLLKKEFLIPEYEQALYIKYTLLEAPANTKLQLQPILAYRNIYSLTYCNQYILKDIKETKNGIRTAMYDGFPELFMQLSLTNTFEKQPQWLYNVHYNENGNPAGEDLYTPGYFEVPVQTGKSLVMRVGLTSQLPEEVCAKANADSAVNNIMFTRLKTKKRSLTAIYS